MPEQLFAIFSFGLVISGIVYLGLARAAEAAKCSRRAAATEEEEVGTEPGVESASAVPNPDWARR